MSICTKVLSDYTEGDCFSITRVIEEDAMQKFMELSGDVSPLHLDGKFAQSRGFRDRVVYGGVLAAYVSMVVGVHMPGQNCLLQAVDVKFVSPAYVGDEVRITTTITQVSEAAQVMLAKLRIERVETGEALAKGKLQIGFTQEVS